MNIQISGIVNKTVDMTRPLLVIADVTALTAALLSALWLRFDGMAIATIYQSYIAMHLRSLLLFAVGYPLLFSRFRLYRYAWRFSSLEVIWSILYASTIGLASLVLVQRMLDGSTLPRSVLLGFWLIGMAYVAGFRIIARMFSEYSANGSAKRRQNHNKSGSTKRVIIIGAGQLGARVLRTIREDAYIDFKVVGFLDDDPKKQGAFISNVRVLGPVKALHKYVEKRAVDEVIMAISAANGLHLQEYVLDCRKHGIAVKVVLHLRDQLDGRTHISMGDYSVEDLLSRPQRSADIASFAGYVTGKRVLVTGAGGSIGSELCRQIIRLQPAQLILFGHGENSIFQIQQELTRDYSELSGRIRPAIGCMANRKRINHLFKEYEPEVVFHAAAHKHVPLMEENVLEAAQNNIVGTHNIVDACCRFAVDRMVLISTDKAAEPRSIMGATKWVCEAVVQAADVRCETTDFITVRFGNVLGSRGSVVSVFKEQIANGGPVTVTHPEMTRYFMTIPEAVRLVLQAGAVGNSGDLYLLDMGNPMKIYRNATGGETARAANV